jgi:lipopolysaccharide transport system permease protein
MALSTKEQDWDIVIEPKAAWLNLNVGELWRYRDLIRLMVWRDVVAVYKQTVLGLLWHVIQPLTTTFTFALIFGKAAGLAPPGVPSGLFYLTGVVPWMYFSSVVTKTSKTFLGGQNIMTKVYFPRLVIPISTATSQLVSFGIQLVTLLVIFAFYTLFRGFQWEVNLNILILPYLILLMALLGLAMGIIVSAMTTKYRDLSFLVGFGVQLLMYASPVIFPLSSSFFNDLPALKTVFELNPMTSIIESMRVIFLGGELDFGGLAYTTVFTVVFSVIGLGLFNRVERMFADII